MRGYLPGIRRWKRENKDGIESGRNRSQRLLKKTGWLFLCREVRDAVEAEVLELGKE